MADNQAAPPPTPAPVPVPQAQQPIFTPEQLQVIQALAKPATPPAEEATPEITMPHIAVTASGELPITAKKLTPMQLPEHRPLLQFQPAQTIQRAPVSALTQLHAQPGPEVAEAQLRMLQALRQPGPPHPLAGMPLTRPF